MQPFARCLRFTITNIDSYNLRDYRMQQELTCKLTTPELQKRRTTVIRELKDLVGRREEITTGFKSCLIFGSTRKK